MASFESSPLAPLPEMVAFLKQNRIVPRAHVALCKGEALDLECLKRSDMTPAQAALLWHTQQGVIPCFGNDTLAHIDENLKAQTAELMGLPPVVAPTPARNLLKLYPTMSMNMPGMMCKDGTREDEGILRKDMDGRYWMSSTRAAGDKWADQLAKMSDGEETLIREIEEALGGIKRDMKSGHERRMSIAGAIAGLRKPVETSLDEKMENLASFGAELKASAEATMVMTLTTKLGRTWTRSTRLPATAAPRAWSRWLWSRWPRSYLKSRSHGAPTATRRCTTCQPRHWGPKTRLSSSHSAG